jgi:hypothetical protein
MLYRSARNTFKELKKTFLLAICMYVSEFDGNFMRKQTRKFYESENGDKSLQAYRK